MTNLRDGMEELYGGAVPKDDELPESQMDRIEKKLDWLIKMETGTKEEKEFRKDMVSWSFKHLKELR